MASNSHNEGICQSAKGHVRVATERTHEGYRWRDVSLVKRADTYYESFASSLTF